ncbi:MAG: glycosyltransferase family 39 protein, partial [Chloroflexota bacterium]
LYSLLAGGLMALLGFSEEIARWPVLLASVLTIAVYYTVARRLFNSSLTGVTAATLVTFDTLLIKWGVWARMYTLAHVFVLLSVAWLFLSIRGRPRTRARYLFLLFLTGALFSHSLTFLLIPALAILLLVFTFFSPARTWFPRGRELWLQAGLGGIIVVAALWVVSQGHVGSTISLQDRAGEAVSIPAGLDFLSGFFFFRLDDDQYLDLFDFFQSSAYHWLSYLIGLAALLTLYRLLRRAATAADMAFLFLLLLPLLVILEMGTFLTGEWRQGRYMIFLTLPSFLLLAAESLARAAVFLRPRLHPGWATVMPLPVILLIGAIWGPPSWDLAHARATGAYDDAFAYVRQNWQPGDHIMAGHPAAAYLYLNQIDYYINQVSAKVLADADEESPPVDRWIGSPLVDTVDRLNAALAGGHRTWLIVGDKHLFRYYEPFFRQQIFAQMDYVYRAGSIYVFVSRPQPRPLPAEPLAALDGNFSHTILLAGYSLDPAAIAADGTLPLGLYWRLIGPAPGRPFKVFVQLRNEQGEIVSQADHFIYEGLFDAGQWIVLQAQDEWLRDTADLRLPLPLPSDVENYRLYVGFYDPETLERLPVVNDTSGENAVVIDLPSSRGE